jgi:hypothetical protein
MSMIKADWLADATGVVVINGTPYRVTRSSNRTVELSGPRGGKAVLVRNVHSGRWGFIIGARDVAVHSIEPASEAPTKRRAKSTRTKAKRSTGKKRRTLTRLRRVRMAFKRHGFGVYRNMPSLGNQASVGDRVGWISVPWGHRVHGLVTAVHGDHLTVQQSNGPVGTIGAAEVITLNKRQMLR